MYLSHTIVGGPPSLCQTKPSVSGRLLLSATEVEKSQTAVIDESVRTSLTLEWIFIKISAIFSEWGLNGAMAAGAPKGGDGGGGLIT